MSVLFLTNDWMFSSRVSACAQSLKMDLSVVADHEQLPASAAREQAQLVLLDLSTPGLDPTQLVPEPMRTVGWACGYAFSIFGTESTQQCPFQSGNGYGDGRAKQIGAAIWAHLATGQPAVPDTLHAAIPSAAEIRAKVA